MYFKAVARSAIEITVNLCTKQSSIVCQSKQKICYLLLTINKTYHIINQYVNAYKYIIILPNKSHRKSFQSQVFAFADTLKY